LVIRTPKSIEEFQTIIKDWRSKYSNSYRTFFRGQPYRCLSPNGNDWIFPSICRENNRRICNDKLKNRLNYLLKMGKIIFEGYNDSPLWTQDDSIKRLISDKFIYYGLCQHYELCETTHLDVTEDFEVAYTFAKNKGNKKGVIYLIKTPRCPHIINVFVEKNLYAVNLIKLLQLIVPQSKRAIFQKAWSLSFYPVLSALTYELYGTESFNLAKYVDIVIDLCNISYKPKFEYQTLMEEDEFYKYVAQPLLQKYNCDLCK
jgi:hypothetical protein